MHARLDSTPSPGSKGSGCAKAKVAHLLRPQLACRSCVVAQPARAQRTPAMSSRNISVSSPDSLWHLICSKRLHVRIRKAGACLAS